ncbi:MAG: hypothetical protein WAM05_04855 [Candidatus Binataceae bacterium]
MRTFFVYIVASPSRVIDVGARGRSRWTIPLGAISPANEKAMVIDVPRSEQGS